MYAHVIYVLLYTHVHQYTETPLITNAGTAVVFHVRGRKKARLTKTDSESPPSPQCKHTFTSQNTTKEVTCSPRQRGENVRLRCIAWPAGGARGSSGRGEIEASGG